MVHSLCELFSSLAGTASYAADLRSCGDDESPSVLLLRWPADLNQAKDVVGVMLAKRFRSIDMTLSYRSLASLEDRYSELRDIAEKKLKLWREKESELQSQIAFERSERERLIAHYKDEAATKLEKLTQQLSIQLKAENEKELTLAISGETSKIGQLDQELRDARRELDLCLLRLSQVQEELVHYFKLSQSQSHSLIELTQTRDQLSKDLQDIRTSTTWRITRPVRKLFDQMRSLVRQ